MLANALASFPAPSNPVAAQASVRRFPQCTNSNNLLAVELEKENDATENFSIDFFRVSFPLNAGSSRRQ
jgi:hypothetical protein